MKKTIVLAVAMVISGIITGQEKTTIDQSFQGTRFVNSQSVNLAEKGEMQLLIQHRFGDISGGFYELFGLDLASMRLGFEYGMGQNVNIGLGRSTFLKTYDGFVKYRLMQQNSDLPVSIVLTAGGSVPTLRDYFPETNDSFSDKSSGNIQLHLARTMGPVGVQVSPGYMKTGYLYAYGKNLNSMLLNFGGSVRLSDKVSANVEYLHAFNSEISGARPFSAGVDIDTGGHLFQLVLTNTQGMFDQALYTNVNGDWGKGKLFFGFNLIREFDINKPIEF